MDNKFGIIYKNKKYEIHTYKICYILSLLETKNLIGCKNIPKIIFLMKKYNFFDENFLNNINRI